MVLRFLYLDGSEQVGFLLAEVEETSNGYPIGQKIDEGHVVDQVVCLSDAQDDDGGEALRETEEAHLQTEPVPHLIYRADRTEGTVLTQSSRAGIGVQFSRWIIARRYGR